MGIARSLLLGLERERVRGYGVCLYTVALPAKAIRDQGPGWTSILRGHLLSRTRDESSSHSLLPIFTRVIHIGSSRSSNVTKADLPHLTMLAAFLGMLVIYAAYLAWPEIEDFFHDPR